MSGSNTSTPTLAEQIKLVRDAIAECENGQPYDGVDKDLRDASAILASLEQLEAAHSQIDVLMKRLLRTEATLRILSDTSHFKDMDAMAEFARIALASQGGGDG